MSSEIISAEEGLIEVVPKRKKVGIIGGGQSRNDAPWNDDDWEFWGLNEMEQPRAERWFEMHPLAVQSPAELYWLYNCKEPVYMLKQYEDVPMSVRYPLGKILDYFDGIDYFTCTFAFQIALAIMEGFEEIGLWGVQLPYGTVRERTVERACVEFWLGLAKGKGIKICINELEGTLWGLLDCPYRYGYDYFEEKTDVDKQMYRLGVKIAADNYLFGKSFVEL